MQQNKIQYLEFMPYLAILISYAIFERDTKIIVPTPELTTHIHYMINTM